MADSIRDIGRSITSLLPDEEYRYQCLTLFLEALLEADNFGANKWGVSNNEERLDMYNGLLLVPNLDAVFDKGLVSFTNEGKIMISPRLPKNDQERLGIHLDLRLTKPFKEQHLKYIKHHREHVFQKE